MALSAEERDRFVAETALHRGVNVDALLNMEALSYTDIIRNADKLAKQASKVEVPEVF